MKKKIKIAVISVLSAIAVFIAAFIGWSVYETEYKLTKTATEISPDGKYTATLYMVGCPEWPFGDTTVRVTIKETESRKRLEAFEADISDDGRNLHEDNWQVNWQENSAEIVLKGCEQRDEIYTVTLQ